MEASPHQFARTLGSHDVHVCVIDVSGVRTLTSGALAGWLDADPQLLERQEPFEREGRLWGVARSELVPGETLHVVSPVRMNASLHAEQSDILTPLVQASPVAILTLDLQMRVTMWNPACERIFGWTAEDVIGKPYPLVPDEEWRRFEGFFQKVMDGQGFNGVEAERKRSDGKRVHIAISTAPIRCEKGDVIGAMAILEDITERKQLEAQYRQAMKLEAVGRLAGGIAHDFNNLLTVILGFSDGLGEIESKDEVREASDAIYQAAQRATKLTQQLLAFSRRQVLRVEVVDLNEIVRATLEIIERLIGADIHVQPSFAAQPTLVRVDPVQIEQVLLNLATNARDAMPLGGTITIDIAQVVKDGVMWAELAVSDTGVGIDSKTAAHIFDPFYTTKEQGKGTGLGLASVHGIAHQSGGDVTVESEPGHGATFRVRLPISDALQTDGKEQQEGTASQPTKLAILLVEDHGEVRQILVRMLTSLGHKLIAAESGEQALERAQDPKVEIDLLITDVVMSGISGGELARRMQINRPFLKTIFVSGYADDEIVRRGAAEGAPLLKKPFTVHGVRDAINRTLDAS